MRLFNIKNAAFLGLIFAFACSSESTVQQLSGWLSNPEGEIFQQDFAQKPLSKEEAEEAADSLLLFYQGELLASKGNEWENRELKFDTFSLPFFYKVWGKEPVGGHSLFISLHGGGSAPSEVNDQQYENQKHLYDSTMSGLEGVYLAARAPSNDWNMWHKAHVDPFIQDIIRLAVSEEGVNPNKVYLLGYSAGGDGVFQLAPRLAPYLAAASMMAGHPGDASAENLRNLPYAIHMGALDSSFNRNGHAAEWGDLLDSLQKQDPEGFVHDVQIHEGRAHWMYRDDAVALPWMMQFDRIQNPKKILWKQDDVVQSSFYWIKVPEDEAGKNKYIAASYDSSGKIEITTKDYNHVLIGINDDMMDLSKPIVVSLNGEVVFEGKVDRTIGSLAYSLESTIDGARAYSSVVEVDCEKKEAHQKVF